MYYPTSTKFPILALQLLLLSLSTDPASALSSAVLRSPPTSSSYPPTTSVSSRVDHRPRTNDEIVSVESVPWRVVLDIGREPLAAALPFDWGRSGCRMPLKIPVQFSKIQSTTTTTFGVTPLADTVSFTGPEGAVVRPVEGGDYRLELLDSSSSPLQLELTFPETLTRRDVSIPAGTTLQCIGTIYTQSELQRLDQEFYQARDAVWNIGQELNDRARRREAPKQWNEQSQKWEQRNNLENPLSWMERRLSYWKAKARQEETNRQRPSANELSSVGRLPGVDDPVYIAKGGMVRAASNGAVMGTWYAEPIVTDPSFYGQRSVKTI